VLVFVLDPESLRSEDEHEDEHEDDDDDENEPSRTSEFLFRSAPF